VIGRGSRVKPGCAPTRSGLGDEARVTAQALPARRPPGRHRGWSR
jgi:hypothetical protein